MDFPIVALLPKGGCDNVDDCITKYKFEEARAYANGYNSDLRNIIKSEVTYYTSQKRIGFCISVNYGIYLFRRFRTTRKKK